MASAHKNPERAFGVSVGTVLLIIAAALWWRGRPARAEVIGSIGAVLLAAGLIYAPILKYPSAWWFRFAHALGYVNARVLLTILFALVLVPVSLVWKVVGKDPLARRRERWSGWSPYPERYRDTNHYERMF